MDSLREKIARMLAEIFEDNYGQGKSFYLSQADRILAIPEIAKALDHE